MIKANTGEPYKNGVRSPVAKTARTAVNKVVLTDLKDASSISSLSEHWGFPLENQGANQGAMLGLEERAGDLEADKLGHMEMRSALTSTECTGSTPEPISRTPAAQQHGRFVSGICDVSTSSVTCRFTAGRQSGSKVRLPLF